MNYRLVTGNTNIGPDDDVIGCIGGIRLSLPSATSVKKAFSIKNLGTNTVTVDAAGTMIDGSNTIDITQQYDSITITPSGSNWVII